MCVVLVSFGLETMQHYNVSYYSKDLALFGFKYLGGSYQSKYKIHKKYFM